MTPSEIDRDKNPTICGPKRHEEMRQNYITFRGGTTWFKEENNIVLGHCTACGSLLHFKRKPVLV